MGTNAGRIHAESSTNPHAQGPTCRFLGFTLDTRRLLLVHGDQTIRLRPRTYDVLVFLALHAGRLVPKQELMDAVWGDVAVTDDSLVQCLVEIRRALGAEQDAVKTIRGRGYLFDTAIDWSDDVIDSPGEGGPASTGTEGQDRAGGSTARSQSLWMYRSTVVATAVLLFGTG